MIFGRGNQTGAKHGQPEKPDNGDQESSYLEQIRERLRRGINEDDRAEYLDDLKGSLLGRVRELDVSGALKDFSKYRKHGGRLGDIFSRAKRGGFQLPKEMLFIATAAALYGSLTFCPLSIVFTGISTAMYVGFNALQRYAEGNKDLKPSLSDLASSVFRGTAGGLTIYASMAIGAPILAPAIAAYWLYATTKYTDLEKHELSTMSVIASLLSLSYYAALGMHYTGIDLGIISDIIDAVITNGVETFGNLFNITDTVIGDYFNFNSPSPGH